MKNLTVLGIILIVLLTSCVSQRKTFREPLKEEGPEFLMKKLKENELQYSTLSAKFSAIYTRNRNKTNVSGQLRMKRDSLIWLSITPMLGIEMARFALSPDSVKFLNRINSTYLLKDFKYVNQLLNKTLDFDMAQAFLTGNDFTLYENNSFRATIDNKEYKLSTSNRRKLKRYVRRSEDEINIPLQSIWLDPNTFKISRVMLKEAERDSRKFTADYSEFVSVDGQNIPSVLDFHIETDEEKIRIQIEYSRLEKDNDPAFPYHVPENYTPIDNIEIK